MDLSESDTQLSSEEEQEWPDNSEGEHLKVHKYFNKLSFLRFSLVNVEPMDHIKLVFDFHGEWIDCDLIFNLNYVARQYASFRINSVVK